MGENTAVVATKGGPSRPPGSGQRGWPGCADACLQVLLVLVAAPGHVAAGRRAGSGGAGGAAGVGGQKRPTRFSVNRTQRPGGTECQGLQLCLAVCCGGWGVGGGWAGTAADKMENEFESHDLIRYHGPDALGLPESL